MILASLRHAFEWGLLVISDEGTTEAIPAFLDRGSRCTAGDGTVVVGIQHGQEGSTVCHVCRGHGDVADTLAFAGTIQIKSGVLVVGNVAGENVIRVNVPSGPLGLRVLLDRADNAEHVDVVLDRAGRPQRRRTFIG